MPRQAAKKPTPVRGMVTIPDDQFNDEHMLETALAAQRAREARTARRALATAAVMCVLRGTVGPLLFSHAPPQNVVTLEAPESNWVHYATACVFAVCYGWARRDPLMASLAAAVIFLAVSAHQILANPVLLGGGHVGKVVTLIIIGRALSAGIMYRVHCGGRQFRTLVGTDAAPRAATA
jgi:hypothetical protein